MLLFLNFIYTYIYVFLLLSGMCLMFCWGYYICAADICAWGYFIYFDKVSCFSLVLGLDQMIWSWVVFVSLTKFMKQEHGKNEEKSEKAWNKIMAIMNQSYLAMKHCPSMHSVFESSVRASFKVSLIFGLSCLYPVAPEPLWFLWCHAAHLPSSV